MPNTKHTPEPHPLVSEWRQKARELEARAFAGEGNVYQAAANQLNRCATDLETDDGVNALAGIENPAEFMEAHKLTQMGTSVVADYMRKVEELAGCVRAYLDDPCEVHAEQLRTALDNLGVVNDH